MEEKYKNCKVCWESFKMFNTIENKCVECRKKWIKPLKIYTTWWIKRTPIKRVWKRTKERLKEFGSERVSHVKKWNNSDKCCVICWTNLVNLFWSNDIKDIPSYCFAHILAKGMYPVYRYLINNLALVCGIPHHWTVDKLIAKRKFEVEKLILNWKEIDFSLYFNENKECEDV